jgi:hypothetical protein
MPATTPRPQVQDGARADPVHAPLPCRATTPHARPARQRRGARAFARSLRYTRAADLWMDQTMSYGTNRPHTGRCTCSRRHAKAYSLALSVWRIAGPWCGVAYPQMPARPRWWSPITVDANSRAWRPRYTHCLKSSPRCRGRGGREGWRHPARPGHGQSPRQSVRARRWCTRRGAYPRLAHQTGLVLVVMQGAQAARTATVGHAADRAAFPIHRACRNEGGTSPGEMRCQGGRRQEHGHTGPAGNGVAASRMGQRPR